MQKVSKMMTGVLLRDTTPAGIEKFLVDRIRNELGEFHDLVVIKPILRIDKEDGDLSGNVTDGYGTVMLRVGNKNLLIPFIIHDKQMLPFDTIRMGEEEVSYDISKLRRLVVALDKKNKEQSDEEMGEDAMSVVDSRDVPTHNGFLGTIMSVRDSNLAQGAYGDEAYSGPSFGDLDEERITKRASKEVDVAEVFEEFHDKLAGVQVFSDDDVKEVIGKIEKQAEDESQRHIDEVSNITPETIEVASVQREFAKLDQTKYVDFKVAASGNNIRFPIFDDTTFEHRFGRVYHKVKTSLKGSGIFGRNITSKIKHIVIDTNNNYAFLNDSDKFMINREQPTSFKFPATSAGALANGNMYAFEWSVDTLSSPFVIMRNYLSSEENNGILVSVPEFADKPLKASQSTLFRNSYECEENGNLFAIVVLIGNPLEEGIKSLSLAEVKEYITINATNSTDHRISSMMSDNYVGDNIYFVNEDFEFFKLANKISGFFSKPDGIFKEGPLFSKTAAYEQANKARLVINEQQKPTTFTVEWSFADGDEEVSMQNKKIENLSPAQAKKVLEDLGYDHRKQALFFEIAKRNGRYAEFALPNVELAKNVTPKERAVGKAKEAIKNIANATLNAGNFVPVLENVMADSAAAFITDAVPSSVDWVQNIQSKLAASRDVAVEFEKIASQVRGSAWSELAYILNMKHHLDKLALDITKGFVKNAEPVFSEIGELEAVIEKTASALIQFNRDQLLRTNSPIVKPELVKQALAELDGFTGYINAGKMMEKKSFFHKGTRKQIEALGNTMTGLQRESGKLVKKLQNQATDMRVLDRKGLVETEQGKKKAEQIKETQLAFNQKVKEIGENAREQEKLNQSIHNKNRVAMAGLGVPGLAAFGYARESSKNK